MSIQAFYIRLVYNKRGALATVPNGSFSIYAPSFLSKFVEAHTVMLQGNAGLKPKEGEVTSQPWQWPINYRVSAGRAMCVSPVDIWRSG